MVSVLTGWILALLGLVIGGGGIWLAILGGSPYYIVMGLGLIISGVALARRKRIGLAVYGVLLLLTLVWSIWEAGFDRWQLVPRGALLALIGLWLLLPFIDGPLRRAASKPRTVSGEGRLRSQVLIEPYKWSGSRRFLGWVEVLLIVVAVASVFHDGYTINGEIPAQQASSAAPGGNAGASGQASSAQAAADDWYAYGGTNYGQRYSSLKDINTENVGKLKLAWTYHTNEMPSKDDPKETTFEVTPLKVGDTLYLCTARTRVIALDAATGKERWSFDPKVKPQQDNQHMTCRGVSYHDSAAAAAAPAAPASSASSATPAAPAATTADAATAPAAPVANAAPAAVATCQKRIVFTTMDARLISLDAGTGKPCESFGKGGTVDLAQGMPNLKPGYYMQTSPPVVTRDRIVVGGSIADNFSTANPSGVIRAFDLNSGRLLWNFDAGNPNVTTPLPEGQSYTAGAPNSWAVSSADEALGLVYVPMGNKSPDLLGEGRSPEVERFSSSIIALDLATGKLRWVRQTVHHDLWDRDVPAQPSLVDLTISGARVPALVGPTKQGDIFVLDRRTGEPILPVKEVPVPASDLPGENASPMQPVSSLNFTPAPLTEHDMWGATPIDQLFCRIEFRERRYDGTPYTPPSTKGSLIFPGNNGVFNWGGVAVDPARGIMVGSPVRLAYLYDLVPRPANEPDKRLVTSDGQASINENYDGGKFAFKIRPFRSFLNLPCQAPPWGSLVGVDLKTGKTVWRRRNGTVRDQMPLVPIPFPMGIASLGGPLITGGGLAFYSGTMDNYLRAYNVNTGKKLWEGRLPAGGQATPMTYRTPQGKQFVVVAAGGHGSLGTTLGDSVVAYTVEQ